MESHRIPYKKDAYGNDIIARVAWTKALEGSQPIALIYHGGGVIVGSSEIIPTPQIDYLVSSGFVVVIPNYRLAPQVTAKEAFADCEDACDWATITLPELMKSEHNVTIDSSRIVAMGHSSGGTIALHLASRGSVKAVTAFYPSLYSADTSTSGHKSTSIPPFGTVPDYKPTGAEWKTIAPDDRQVSEAPLALPGTVPAPRNRWQMDLIKHGEWMSTIAPDGDFAAIDPLTRVRRDWPPIMIVQDDGHDIGGSSLELAQRAETEMKAAGVKEVRLEVVKNATHMFDLSPTVGTSDLGPKWQAVVKGLNWLGDHV